MDNIYKKNIPLPLINISGKIEFPTVQSFSSSNIPLHKDLMKIPQMQKCALNLLIGSPLRACPRNHNKIITTSEAFLIKSVAFPDKSRNPVSYNAISHFFTYRYSNSVPALPVFHLIHNKILIRAGNPFFINILKIFVFFSDSEYFITNSPL